MSWSFASFFFTKFSRSPLSLLLALCSHVVTKSIFWKAFPASPRQLELSKPAMRRATMLLLSRAAAMSSQPSSSSSSSCRRLLADAMEASASSSSTSSSFALFLNQRRSLAIPCNLKLGTVPPPPLVVRYSKGGADAFIELADELEEAVPGLMVEGKEDEEEASKKNSVTEVLAPGGKTLLAVTKGKPVLARDVLAALEKWQQEEEQKKK